MHNSARRAPGFSAAHWICLAGIVSLFGTLLTGCDNAPVVSATPMPSPSTPSPKEQALIERAVHDKLAEENRITELQLANARAAAAQRAVGVQMFRDLEAQYRERAATRESVPSPILETRPFPEPTPSPVILPDDHSPAR